MTTITSTQFEPISTSKYPVPEGIRVECGYLTVPESRSVASGNFPSARALRIYVTLVKSLSPNPAPDPTIFLYGGPGGHSGDVLNALQNPSRRDLFLGGRDLILFDQRGTGFSEPALFAPEVETLLTDAFLQDYDAEERARRFVSAMLNVHDHFVSQGINLAAINTPEIVADLNDLRLALGYAKVNLYGVSYGTRIALVAMRDFPEGIRSVILDSTVPVQVSQYVEAIPNAMHTFNRLFDAVTADPQANAAYPNLRATFFEVIESLNNSPVRLPTKHPRTGEEIHLRLTGDVLIGSFCLGFYSREAIANMPKRIDQVYRGNYQEVAKFLTSMLAKPVSNVPAWSVGMYYSVNFCDDKVTAKTAREITNYAVQYPEMSSLPLTEFHLGKHITDLGMQWGARPAGAAEHKAVVSDIPTLILAGEFDQNTPAYWGKLAGETLSKSTYVEFPGMGHAVISQGSCAATLIKAFLDSPLSPIDDSCVQTLIREFIIPKVT